MCNQYWYLTRNIGSTLKTNVYKNYNHKIYHAWKIIICLTLWIRYMTILSLSWWKSVPNLLNFFLKEKFKTILRTLCFINVVIHCVISLENMLRKNFTVCSSSKMRTLEILYGNWHCDRFYENMALKWIPCEKRNILKLCWIIVQSLKRMNL